jgi:hypothetical protein
MSIQHARERRTFLQKDSSLRTSASDTSCGVVTTTAPSMPHSRMYCVMDMCSSEVPGGASTTWTRPRSFSGSAKGASRQAAAADVPESRACPSPRL